MGVSSYKHKQMYTVITLSTTALADYNFEPPADINRIPFA
jgi:hypothetical protein